MRSHKFAVDIQGKKLKCFYTRDPVHAETAIARLLNNSTRTLGFDIETGKIEKYRDDKEAGLDPYRSFPSLMQFYDGIDTCYMFDTKPGFGVPLSMFNQVFKEKRLIAHNAIFDASHMAHAGHAGLRFDCSMMLYNAVRCADYASQEQEEKALEEDWEPEEGDGEVLDWLGKGERYGASLRSVVAKLLGFEISKDLQTSNWTDRGLDKEQLVYAAADSWLTYEVGKILGDRAVDLGLSTVYKLNRKAIHPVVRMMLTGCRINEEMHEKNLRKWVRQKDELHLKLLRVFGPRMNMRSPVQMSNWLERNLPIATQHMWARSEKSGYLKTDAKTLSKFLHLPFVSGLLEYKTLDKVINTYGYKLLDKINPVTGKLHTRFTLLFTATGRMSSRDPNVQNMPVRKTPELRKIFQADEGCTLLAPDYNQIEMRVIATLSGDKAMLKAFHDGIDLHVATAAEVLGVRIDRVTDDQRRLAKSLNFGLIFGLGVPGLIEYAAWNYRVKLTKNQAYKLYAAYFKLFVGMANWQASQRSVCGKQGFVDTVLGKRRALQPVGTYTRAVNHPVQGTAAEIVIESVNLIDKATRNIEEIKMLLTCHDENLAQCPLDMQKETEEILEANMIDAAVKILPGIPTRGLVSLKAGATWAAAKG